MACCPKKKNEIVCCNTLFKYDLEPVGENTYDLVVTPCNIPTAVFNVARITVRENSCNQINYYQAFINTDPVQIIQDCSLENLICRCIEIYFDNLPTIHCNSCNRSGFNLF